MTVEDFHRSRRMFVILDGKVVLGPEDSPLMHKEWFEKMGLDGRKTVENCVRGFADDRGLFFYRGKGFDADENDEREFITHLGEIASVMSLPQETQVFAGVVKTNEVRYPPKKKLGTIASLLT